MEHDDPRLIDRTGELRIATTNPASRTVYFCKDIQNELLEKVLIHELGHCSMISYGLLPYIHSLLKEDRYIEAEEWLCNYIAEHGKEILDVSAKLIAKR